MSDNCTSENGQVRPRIDRHYYNYIPSCVDDYVKKVFARSADKSIFKTDKWYKVFAPTLLMYLEFKRHEPYYINIDIDILVRYFLIDEVRNFIFEYINKETEFDALEHLTFVEFVKEVILADINYYAGRRPNHYAYLLKDH